MSVASNNIASSAIRVGLKDRAMSGWCNSATGELVDGVVIRPGLDVVDVGCGDGGYINFCGTMGANLTFVDIQEGKVRALEQQLKGKARGTVNGIVSNCDPIPLPDGCADVVINTEVIEHVRDPAAFLRELVRLGREDATYVLTVPDARGDGLIKGIAPDLCFEEPNHIHLFSADDFQQLVQSCGLEVIRHEYLSAFWAIFYLLKWSTTLPGEGLTDNVHPATYYWTRAWEEMLQHPNGDKARTALNRGIPRCQMIVARRRGGSAR